MEREGLSVRHPARFVLVGSGNPEEGELRPQLLDRFGLCVEVSSPSDVKQRIAVIRSREAYERDPQAFIAAQAKAEARERRAILKARESLPHVAFPDDVLELVSTICMALGVDGLRGELTLMRAARANAALNGAAAATKQDVLGMASSALRHRLRRDPLDDLGSTARVERAIAAVTAPAGGSERGPVGVMGSASQRDERPVVAL